MRLYMYKAAPGEVDKLSGLLQMYACSNIHIAIFSNTYFVK